ncbi:nucleotidyltransferase family protein [Pseudomonas capeferrum]|uniref:nucleotidyltransferase family protein n=1 Tax=Pseudomonas capeferrum TaxID=1495066 RepID=UPI0015E3D716|nr:nucleotidyltransferase family protein [Pseudomonas capeferrum]MBA1203281.1 nucleotidyltransferase family protein [Pseudomonas capeferrum]
METITGLVLAAGFSRRFGADKRKAPLPGGQTLLATSLSQVLARLPEVWVVLRPEDDRRALGIADGVNLVRGESAALGMGHSLASGIEALDQHSKANAVAIFLGDMPWIADETLARLFAEAGAERIVVPVHQGQPGHPVIFGRRFWPELRRLTGDEGARAVVKAHPNAVIRVEVSDPGVLRDVDVPAALITTL